MIKRNYILLIFMLFAFIAKTQNLTGIVYEINDKKEKVPLVGVNINWINTTIGTTTNNSGKFSLSKESINDTRLIFRMIGYKTDTFLVAQAQVVLNNQMVSEATNLSQVEISDHSGSYVSKMNSRNVQVLTTGELYKAACCNLAESFETNASVDVSFSDAITGAKQIQMLGLSGIYSQIQTENVPSVRGMASPFGLNYIPGSWMESIQIAKGMSSVVNGYESITGQINVEYKKPATADKLFVNLYANSNARFEANVNGAHKFNDKLSSMLMLHASDFRNAFDRNHDNFMDLPKMNTINIMNRWDFINNGKFISRFGIKYLEENRNGGTMDYKESTFIDDTSSINKGILPYGFSFKTKRSEVFWKNGIMFPEKPYKSVAIILSGVNHEQNGTFGLTNYSGTEKTFYANLLFQNVIKNTDHKFTAGLSYIFDKYIEGYNQKLYTYRYQYQTIPNLNDYNLFTISDSSKYFVKNNVNLDRVESVPGAFFEFTNTFSEKLTLIAGIRGDYHNKYGFFVTPRINIRYHLDSTTTIRASAGLGYRTANLISENLSLLSSQRTLDIASNLDQEKAANYGLNITKEFKLFKRKSEIDLDIYRTDFQNQIIVDLDSTPTTAYFYNLDGKSFANSYQIQWTFEPIKRFTVLLAYRINDVRTTIGGKLLRKPFVNSYKGLVNLAYATRFDKWKYDVTAQFNGSARLADQSKMPEKIRRDNNTPQYMIINAQISRKFKHFDVYLGAENLGDFTQLDPITEWFKPYHTHFDTTMAWGPIVGRTIYAGLRYAIK